MIHDTISFNLCINKCLQPANNSKILEKIYFEKYSLLPENIDYPNFYFAPASGIS